MATQCGTVEIKEDISEIKMDIKEMKSNLAEHMSRTAANEARLELMEKFVVESTSSQQVNNNLILDKVIAQSDKNQAALNKQLKLAIGVFAAVAILVSALAAWIKVGAV